MASHILQQIFVGTIQLHDRIIGMGKDVKRLFAQFQPKHYKLNMVPDRESGTFTGTVIIVGQKVGRPSQRLIFHQNGLKITEAHVTKHDKRGDEVMSVDRINHHGSFDEVRLHSKQMLYPGQYTVRMTFSGVITRNMEGIYPCFFKHDNKEKKLVATQFESHHARDAFPCIDEPEAKAVFDLTLTSPAGETAIANTPVKAQQTKGDLLITEFEPTPKMSTYLLAFVYGELGYKESKTKNGTVVRVYATPDNVKHTDFALDCAVKTLEFYNQYFDIPYPLAKCDFIALPDFASGAMENWGCITFREHALLMDPDNTSLDMKQYIANVIAHELTHQWFGNLVTMRWWTDLWLNEGFASWMSYLAVNHLFPEWKVWEQFIGDDQLLGLKADSLEHTHPIEVPIHHPDEIRTIFDSISYDKGASVLHMLHEYLGPDMFRDGLRYYLKKHSYANTDGVDLWDALESVSGKPVRAFMQAWVTKSGYPIVQATIAEHEVTLKQSRFYLNPKADTAATHWPVPLLPSQDIGASNLDGKTLELQVHADTRDLLLNYGRSGFYRVTYNASHLHTLAEAVANGRLKPLDRYGLLADAVEAAKAGQGSTADALHLLQYYKNEDNTIVWDAMAGALGSVRSVMDDDALREAMKPYIRKLIAKQLDRLGWDKKPGEAHFDTLLRPTMISLAAIADHQATLDTINHLFATMQQPADISPDLRGIVYTSVAQHGNQQTFDRLLAMHNESTSSEERTKLCAALVSFKQPELIDQALALITSEHVRLQDVPYWLAYSLGNRHAKHAAWRWIQDNWQWLDDNLGNDLSFYRIPVYVARSFSDDSFLDEYNAFFKAHMKPAFDRSVKQGIETIQWQAAWKHRDLKEIKAFFTK
jgi:aminopeptidase N